MSVFVNIGATVQPVYSDVGLLQGMRLVLPQSFVKELTGGFPRSLMFSCAVTAPGGGYLPLTKPIELVANPLLQHVPAG